MVFSSPFFLGCFLPLVLLLHRVAPPERRNAVLLCGSLFFYAWGEPRAVFLMLGLIAVCHRCALGIENARRAGRRRAASLILAAGLFANLGALAVFKYASFAIGNLAALGLTLPDPHIPLPIGISFYSFQCVSYLVDVSRGTVPAARSPRDFALYVSLFPQLVAGPIVRYSSVAAQLRDRAPDAAAAVDGFARFGRGLAKKAIIADTLALSADAAFPADVSGMPVAMAWFGTICYALQIYYDFSGYSDMAIGLGRIMGFDFPENFDHPYSASSLRDFWRRWHMSLSGWLRDYVYIPLGGSRRGRFRTAVNTLAVFSLCGLWHGASWCFVAWGAWHGAGVVVERLFRGSRRASAPRSAALRAAAGIASRAGVLLFALVGWVPFKAGTDGRGLAYAASYLRLMFTGHGAGPFFSWRPALDATGPFAIVVLCVAAALCMERPAAALAPSGRTTASRVAGFALFSAALVFALSSGYSPFIYFRF